MRSEERDGLEGDLCEVCRGSCYSCRECLGMGQVRIRARSLLLLCGWRDGGQWELRSPFLLPDRER